MGDLHHRWPPGQKGAVFLTLVLAAFAAGVSIFVLIRHSDISSGNPTGLAGVTGTAGAAGATGAAGPTGASVGGTVVHASTISENTDGYGKNVAIPELQVVYDADAGSTGDLITFEYKADFAANRDFALRWTLSNGTAFYNQLFTVTAGTATMCRVHVMAARTGPDRWSYDMSRICASGGLGDAGQYYVDGLPTSGNYTIGMRTGTASGWDIGGNTTSMYYVTRSKQSA